MSKSLEEAIRFLDYVAHVSKRWNDPIAKDNQSQLQGGRLGGIYVRVPHVRGNGPHMLGLQVSYIKKTKKKEIGKIKK